MELNSDSWKPNVESQVYLMLYFVKIKQLLLILPEQQGILLKEVNIGGIVLNLIDTAGVRGY